MADKVSNERSENNASKSSLDFARPETSESKNLVREAFSEPSVSALTRMAAGASESSALHPKDAPDKAVDEKGSILIASIWNELKPSSLKSSSDNAAEKYSLSSIEDKRPEQAGFSKLGASAEQIKRALGRLDPEIWDKNIPGSLNAKTEQLNNLRELQKEAKGGKSPEQITSDLGSSGKYPPEVQKKIDAFLIGEAASEIMKQAQIKGQSDRLTKEDGRLLKESVLAIKLGHLPSESEYNASSGNLDKVIKDLQKDYPAAHDWTTQDHEKINALAKRQETKTDHWTNGYAKPTHDGILACAAFVTNGDTARKLGTEIMPSLDLNMNGVVGESLLRGFQPRTISEAVSEGKHASVKDAMGFVVRPPNVKADFSTLRAGHIGFLDTTTAEATHNKLGVGTREPVFTSDRFPSADKSYALVPPGWKNLQKH